MIAALVDDSDGTDDDDGGDVGSEDVDELLLRDFFPPLPVVVVHQPPPNKVPSQNGITKMDHETHGSINLENLPTKNWMTTATHIICLM